MNKQSKYANDSPANLFFTHDANVVWVSSCRPGEKRGSGGNIGHVNIGRPRWKILVNKQLVFDSHCHEKFFVVQLIYLFFRKLFETHLNVRIK